MLELVVFRLRDGRSREQLLGTVEGVAAWISQRPGFISRELVPQRPGCSLDAASMPALDRAEAIVLSAEMPGGIPPSATGSTTALRWGWAEEFGKNCAAELLRERGG